MVDITITPTRARRRLAAGTATFTTTRVIADVTALFMPSEAAGAVPGRH